MQTPPLQIPGIPQPVTLRTSQWVGKLKVFAGETEIPTKRGKFEYPGPDGNPIPGRIKPQQIWQAYPKLEFGGTTYATGVEPATWLKVLACLPIVLVGGGLLGALCGFAALLTNFAVIRSGASKGAVVAASVGSLLVGIVVYLAAATAFGLAMGL